MTMLDEAVNVQGRVIRVARYRGEKFTFPKDPDQAVHVLRERNVSADLFTYLEHPFQSPPQYSYHMEWDNLAVLPVSTFEHWWKEQIRSLARNRARQAEKKGVVVREVPYCEDLLQGIVRIHNETPIRQGKRFPHYGMDLNGAHEYAGDFLNRSVFLGAFFGETLIGFAKLAIADNLTHACAVSILAMIRHRDKAPTNALIAQAVRSCANRGIPYLVYEHFSYGKKAGDSLSQFKQSNGFRRLDVPRYYIPLNVMGRAALACGLHRRFTDYCPEVVMSRLRRLRTAWCSRVLQTSPEAL